MKLSKPIAPKSFEKSFISLRIETTAGSDQRTLPARSWKLYIEHYVNLEKKVYYRLPVTTNRPEAIRYALVRIDSLSPDHLLKFQMSTKVVQRFRMEGNWNPQVPLVFM